MKEIDPHLPIDKTAALVVARSRDKGTDHKKMSYISSMAPLPMRPFTGPKEHDLTGRKAGRFIVIGCATFKPRNQERDTSTGTRWVVRCSCGRYQMLTTRGVKKAIPELSCLECHRTQKLRSRDWTIIDKVNGFNLK